MKGTERPAVASNVIVAAGILAALVVIPAALPASMVHAFDVVGYAVCHRIPERSFIIGAEQLPMCARDTGMFGMALIASLVLVALHSERVDQFPKARFAPFLMLGALAWVLDGFNSYYLLVTGRTLWYVPRNELRLVTGALMGIGLAAFVVPFVNAALWRSELAAGKSSVGDWRTMFALWASAAAWVAVVTLQLPLVYGTLATISGSGAIYMLGVVNTLIVILLMRKDNKLGHWREMRLPIMAGLALTLVEIGAIVAVRSWLTARYNLPY